MKSLDINLNLNQMQTILKNLQTFLPERNMNKNIKLFKF